MLALPPAAFAQDEMPQGMPDPRPEGMPDPRSMSGIPRGDQKVPPGTVTVKLTRGELGRYVSGAPVHLVSTQSDGEIVKRTATSDAEGRAEFRDLPSGSTHFAYAVVNGDRLESQMITMPPEVGIRLMLTSRKLDEAGQPVGPPIDESLEEGFPAPGPGFARIILGGEVAPGQVVKVRQLGSEASFQAKAEPQGDRLVASFEDLPVGPDHVYVAELTREGRVYRSAAFMMTEAAGVAKPLVVIQNVLFGLQGGGSLDDERMWFELTLAIANVSGAPMIPEGDGLFIPLPDGFRSIEIREDMKSRVEVVEEHGIRWKGAIPPGQHDIVVTFNIPVDDGSFRFDMEMPYGLQFAHVFVERAPGADLSAKGMNVSVRQSNGRSFFLLGEVQLEPGERLTFAGSGFPMRPRIWRYAGWAVGLLVVGLIGVAIAVILMGRRDKKTPLSEAAARKELMTLRDRLYEDLVDLERRRAAGVVEDLAYDRERKALMYRLVVVHRDLDALDTAKPRQRQST
jgi:hypothetical protein